MHFRRIHRFQGEVCPGKKKWFRNTSEKNYDLLKWKYRIWKYNMWKHKLLFVKIKISIWYQGWPGPFIHLDHFRHGPFLILAIFDPILIWAEANFHMWPVFSRNFWPGPLLTNFEKQIFVKQSLFDSSNVVQNKECNPYCCKNNTKTIIWAFTWILRFICTVVKEEA